MANKKEVFRGKTYTLHSYVTNYASSTIDRKVRELRKKGYNVHIKYYGKKGSVSTAIYTHKK